MRRPEVRFVLLLAALLALFFGVAETELFQRSVRLPSLRLSADLSAALLRGLGEQASSQDFVIRSPELSLEIGDGCDALEPIGLFAAATLAAPVAWSLRLIGVAAGALLLFMLNQVRIVTLYYTGVHRPEVFDTAHLEIWQGIFIALTVGLWLAWASWSFRVDARRE
jgi:exosortase/archaeosortase family protein